MFATTVSSTPSIPPRTGPAPRPIANRGRSQRTDNVSTRSRRAGRPQEAVGGGISGVGKGQITDAGISPHRRGSSPRNAGNGPRKLGNSPWKAGDAPQDAGSIPRKLGNSPRKPGTFPWKAGNSPRKLGNAPEGAGGYFRCRAKRRMNPSTHQPARPSYFQERSSCLRSWASEGHHPSR